MRMAGPRITLRNLLIALLLAWGGSAQVCAQQTQPPTPQTGATAVTDPAAPVAADGTEAIFPRIKDTRFWLSGQANFIFQTHSEFSALYSGAHSLGPHYEK